MPSVSKGEKVGSYVSRCVSVRQQEHPGEPTNQSVAICYSMYEQQTGKKVTRRSQKEKFDLNGPREVRIEKKPGRHWVSVMDLGKA